MFGHLSFVRRASQDLAARTSTIQPKHLNQIGEGVLGLESAAPNMVELGLMSSQHEKVDENAEKVMRMCKDLFEDLQAGRCESRQNHKIIKS